MNRYIFVLILGTGLVTPALAYADFDADAYFLAQGKDAANTDENSSSASTSDATANIPPQTVDNVDASTEAPAVVVNPTPAVNAALDAATPAAATATPATAATPTAAPAATPAASATPPASAAATAPSTPSTPATLFGDVLKNHNISISGAATLDAYSRYVWRGQYLDRRPVFEPGVSLTANGLTVGYWSNWDANNGDPVNSDESDYYMSYAYTIGNWTGTVGHTWYGFPGAGSNSKEFNFGVAYNGFLSPTFTFYHDYKAGQEAGEGNGNYYDITLSQTNDLYKPYGITYTLGATFGLVDHQWIDGIGEHVTPTLMVNIPINANMTLCPTIGYNITAGALHDKDIGNFEDSFFGGVHTNINF